VEAFPGRGAAQRQGRSKAKAAVRVFRVYAAGNQFVVEFDWSNEAKSLPRTRIEFIFNALALLQRQFLRAFALLQVLSNLPIGVLTQSSRKTMTAGVWRLVWPSTKKGGSFVSLKYLTFFTQGRMNDYYYRTI
jgi:hypothetical protein